MRRNEMVLSATVLLLVFSPWACESAFGDCIVAWGEHLGLFDYIPPGNDFVDISSACGHALALKSDGTVVAWGNTYPGGPCDVPENMTFIGVSAGLAYSCGVRSDGSIVAWGAHSGLFDYIPPGNDFVDISSACGHALALRSDGTVVAWGNSDPGGPCDVPENTTFIAVSAGLAYSCGVRSDGSIVVWGEHLGLFDYIPPGNDFVDISSTCGHALALKSDGTIVAWGNTYPGGPCDVPENTTFTAVSAGLGYSSALVPTPAASVLGVIGLGFANWRLRRRREI